MPYWRLSALVSYLLTLRSLPIGSLAPLRSCVRTRAGVHSNATAFYPKKDIDDKNDI
ncbi:MAG TPA: hypothetical protein VJJ79_02245 [Candidatus Nanoarchaeia archaeon]|nr:hypothetical protein [Candidatus Nanoarchaeia archaeon]